MLNEFSRMEILLGEEGVERLAKAKVAVFGLGGVGSYAAEALARCGIGGLILVDFDEITVTNINRQIYALHSTVGKPKTAVAKDRIRDISPDILVRTYETFYNEDTADMFQYEDYDYIIDAMNTVPSKLLLIEYAKKSSIPVISSMGTANKLEPTKLEIADISKTSVCPMAKVMRTELRKRGIRRLKVVYSRERPRKILQKTVDNKGKVDRLMTGSIAFMPSVAGMCIASEVIKDLLAPSRK